MQKRYLVYYVGQDSHDHFDVVWADSREKAVAKVEDKGGEMIKVVKRLMSPLALFGIYLGVIAFIVLVIVQVL